jgi:hypothetical protein
VRANERVGPHPQHKSMLNRRMRMLQISVPPPTSNQTSAPWRSTTSRLPRENKRAPAVSTRGPQAFGSDGWQLKKKRTALAQGSRPTWALEGASSRSGAPRAVRVAGWPMRCCVAAEAPLRVLGCAGEPVRSGSRKRRACGPGLGKCSMQLLAAIVRCRTVPERV